MEYLPVKDKFLQATQRWKQFNRYILLIIGFVGAVVIGAISFGFYRGAQVYYKHFPLIDASMEMRLEATTAYLWFEEMLGGDSNKTMKDILKHLDQAEWYAVAMMKGGKSGHLTLQLDAHSPFQENVQILHEQIKQQRELLQKRTTILAGVGPGSDIDQAYHALLDAFVKNANALEMEIKGIMVKDMEVFKFICYGVIAFSALLFSIAGFAFYRYEHLRRKSYSDFMQMQRLMVQSEKMASLGMMISGIAHEVNNPNNFISFNIPILHEYLQELLPIVDQHAKKKAGFELCNMPYSDFRLDLEKLLKNIENGSQRINRIVSDLKEFSRKRDKMKKEWVNLRQVLDSATAMCSAKIKSLIDSFEISVPGGRLDVYCDPEIVELILINFLMNAAEASHKKDSWVRLKVSLDQRNNRPLVLEVSDNGSGVETGDMDRIFEPFFSTKSSKGGTGMGLYLCRSLADQMGAHIGVDSQAGQGSTFRLIIPNAKPLDEK